MTGFRAPEPPLVRLGRMEQAVWQWPTFGLIEDVRPALAAARGQGEAVVLATLASVEGRAPRGVGAQMLFADGQPLGYLAGGCIEADVAAQAQVVAASGAPRRVVYGVGGPPDLPLPCGSRIEVLVERVAPEDPAVGELLRLTAARRPAIWISDGSYRACCTADGSAPLAGPGMVVRRFDPTVRLVVVGCEPVAIAVMRLGVEAGWEVVALRPKGPAEPPPIDGLRYLRAAPEAAFAELALDPWTAVALLTHDPETDHAALVRALRSAAGYVGVLGSRTRLARRAAALAAAGLTPDQIGRLHAPIGLKLGGRGAFPVALGIVAEISQALAAAARVDEAPLQAEAG